MLNYYKCPVRDFCKRSIDYSSQKNRCKNLIGGQGLMSNFYHCDDAKCLTSYGPATVSSCARSAYGFDIGHSRCSPLTETELRECKTNESMSGLFVRYTIMIEW